MSQIITVLLATADRPVLLKETLLHILSQERDNFVLQVIVADNGLSEVAQQVIASVDKGGEVRRVVTKGPGRSRAVNNALSSVEGDYLFFTDDDVTPNQRWLADQVVVFRLGKDRISTCGPIVPVYHHPCPLWLAGSFLEKIAYARFHPQPQSGLLDSTFVPLGPNFGVRVEAIKGMRFREDLGPSLVNGPLSCDDLAFASELRTRHLPLFEGGGFHYVASAGVWHRVRAEQMSDEWIFDRFFSYGRSLAQMNRGLGFLRSPSIISLEKKADTEIVRKRQSVEFSFYLGQLTQLLRLGSNDSADFVREWLKSRKPCLESVALGELGSVAKQSLW